MKKLDLNRNIRLGLIGILIIFIGIIIFLLYNSVRHPGTKEAKTIIYHYNNVANVNYSVYLKPNIVYPDKIIGEGEIYLTQFVDFVRPNFTYQFAGDRSANIKGDYEIIAKVEGYTVEEKKEKIIWSKQFSIVPKTNFEANQKDLTIEQAAAVRLDDYNIFVTQVSEASSVDVQTRMSVLMNVNIEATTDKGSIRDNVSPSITIPLNASYFSITKNEIAEKPGAIEESKTVQLPINKKLVVGYSMLLAILLISLIYIHFYTRVTTTDPYEKYLKKIFKKHGNRFVALDKDPDATYYNYNQVNSIEDLVKIADELEKPIMYKYSADYEEISKFCVCADSYLYVYDLTDTCRKLKGKETTASGSVPLPKKNNSQTKDM